MHTKTSILTFEDVTIEAVPPYNSGVWQANLVINPADLILVRLESAHSHLPLADGASGLIHPDEGKITFAGRSWQDMSADEGSRARAKIGRVFADGGWISSMDLDENILLAQRHHSRRPDRLIMDEAAQLALVFGLPGLPRGSPALARRQDLQMAACVRAFLGEPILIILERPTVDVQSEIMPGLMHSIRSARDRGAAILWLTAESEVWNDPGILPTRTYLMSGSQLLPVER